MVNEEGLRQRAVKSRTDRWAGAKSIGQAITQIQEYGECRVEVRYFLSSGEP